MHEMFHVIGLQHTHVRTDADQVNYGQETIENVYQLGGGGGGFGVKKETKKRKRF